MALSTDLISQFVKVTKTKQPVNKDTSVYGTTTVIDGDIWVAIDGSDRLIPIKDRTVSVENDERVEITIKNHAISITGNLSTPAASSHTVSELGKQVSEFDTVIADKVDTDILYAELANIKTLDVEEFTAINAVIKRLDAEKIEVDDLSAINVDIENLKTNKLDAEVANITYATIEGLTATDADIYNLKATYATVENLNATNAKVNNIEANYVKTETLEADYITADEIDTMYLTAGEIEAAYVKATQLDADHINANTIASQVAKIDTLIFGSASGNVIHADFSNAVIAQMGDAWIGDAMIDNVSASKITSGNIITNNVQIASEDGSLLISDETIQITDDNDKVRVQIGKDASNDYSINIWDAEGNLMFSEGGLTEDAVKEAIIRNDMVSDTANISASKLNISSLFKVINEDGTHTLNSSKIYLSDEEQTLDIAFSSMTSKTDVLTTNFSDLSATVDGLSSTVGTITTDVNKLETSYSTLSQDVIGIEATVASHTTTLGNKADISAVTEVNDKVTSLTADLNGFRTTVSDTYALKTGNLVKNGFGEYLDNTGFSAATYTRGDCPENEGIYGYFNGAARSAIIPYDPSKTYNYEYYCRLHEGKTGNSYFSIIPIDIDGNPIIYNQVMSDYNTSLFYLAEDLNVGDTSVKVVDLTNWITNTTQTYQRSFLFFGYADSTGYVYPDGTYSRYVYSSIYASNDSVDKSTNTITLTKAWSGKAFPAGSCFAQVTAGATYCYCGQTGAIKYTEWKKWSGTLQATKDHRLPYASDIQVFLYNGVADYCGIYLAEKPYGLNDLEDRVTTAETNITQNAEEIVLRATTSDVNALTNRVSKAESNITQNAEEIVLRATTSDVNALTNRVSKAESNITQNAEEIALCVTQESFDETLDGYYTITEADSAITQKANEITSTVKSSIESIQVGGTNLLLNSSFTENKDGWSGEPAFVEIDGVKCAYFVGALSKQRTISQSIIDKLDLTDLTQEYVFSADVRLDNYVAGTTNPFVKFYFSGQYDNNGTSTWMGATGVKGSSDIPTQTTNGEWTRLKWVVKFARVPTSMLLYIYTRDYTGTLYFKNLKLEKGNKATDWSPAPEDHYTKSQTESLIEQTSESITSSVSETLTGYYTKAEAQSVIEQTANNISLSVVEDVQIGSRNYAAISKIYNASMADYSYEAYVWSGTHDGVYEGLRIDSSALSESEQYVVSYTVTVTAGTLLGLGGHIGGNTVNKWYVNGTLMTSLYNITRTTVWGIPEADEYKVVVYLTASGTDDFYIQPNRGSATSVTFSVTDIMIEKGNKKSDWTAAPEDINNAITDVTDIAGNIDTKITTMESRIDILENSIKNFVRGADGSSLVIQEDDGVGYFDLSTILNDIDTLYTSTDVKTNVLSNRYSALNTSIEELKGKTEYIVKGVNEDDEPYIELGDPEDNNYKMHITNTSIELTDGTEMLMEITDKKSSMTKVVIREELQLGNDNDESVAGVWLFKRRSNGNAGFIWKDVNS